MLKEVKTKSSSFENDSAWATFKDFGITNDPTDDPV